jgi:hypothetical protein
LSLNDGLVRRVHERSEMHLAMDAVLSGAFRSAQPGPFVQWTLDGDSLAA